MQRAVRSLSIIGFGLASVMLTGCASIVSGTSQEVSVQTAPVTGASCTLSNDKGDWRIAKTPGTVTLHKSGQILKVACHKKGYRNKAKNVQSNMKPVVAGNLLFGGPIGAGIDLVDGAAYSYPSVVQMPMTKKKTA